HPARCATQQRDGSVRIATHQVDIAGTHLREHLEELGVVRAPGLLPGRLPRLVRGEEVALADIATAELVVLLQRQRVEVRHLQLVLGAPWLGPAELVPGARGVLAALAGAAGRADGFFWHDVMLLPLGEPSAVTFGGGRTPGRLPRHG